MKLVLVCVKEALWYRCQNGHWETLYSINTSGAFSLPTEKPPDVKAMLTLSLTGAGAAGCAGATGRVSSVLRMAFSSSRICCACSDVMPSARASVTPPKRVAATARAVSERNNLIFMVDQSCKFGKSRLQDSARG